MTQFIVVVEGLTELNQYVDGIPEAIERAATRAINRTTRDGRAMFSRAIRAQVAFPAAYVSPSNRRLYVSKFASKGDLEGVISAQNRATSLARFTKDQPLARGKRRPKRGIKLTVKPGVARYTDSGSSSIKGAFVIPLGGEDNLNNRGLAVRSDTKPSGAHRPRKLSDNLWLLYGPSVAQTLLSGNEDAGIAVDLAPELATKLEAEFYRQQALDL